MHRLELGVDELERPGQGDADAAEEQREPGLGARPAGIRGSGRGQGLEDWPQFDLLFEPLEGVHALLEALGDRQVPRLDDVADVGLRGGLADDQQVVERVVDEIEVALDVVAVDVDTSPAARKKRSNLVKPITAIAVTS